MPKRTKTVARPCRPWTGSTRPRSASTARSARACTLPRRKKAKARSLRLRRGGDADPREQDSESVQFLVRRRKQRLERAHVSLGQAFFYRLQADFALRQIPFHPYHFAEHVPRDVRPVGVGRLDLRVFGKIR